MPGWPGVARSGHSLRYCLPYHAQHVPVPHRYQCLPPAPTYAHWASWNHKVGVAEVVQPAPAPAPRASGPLAGTVGGLLHRVGHPGGVRGAEELHGAPLQAHLAAALAEAGVGVDVVVVDAGRGTPPVAGH